MTGTPASERPTTAPTTVNLDLTGDIVDLTAALCDVPSVSRDEATLADAIEVALRAHPHLEVFRDGHAIVARTNLGRAERVVVAGHIDTVPIAANLPTELRTDPETGETVLWGRGTVDMKAGVAVQLQLAATLTEPSRDVTYVFYDAEEIAERYNGLKRLVEQHPDWVAGDFAVLMEPTASQIEGGCNGTLRVTVTTRGVAAHSARAWMGRNAIHGTADILQRLAAHRPQTVTVDGLDYREGLNAVAITGGIAGNVIPDRCTVTINYRFAPDKSGEAALAVVREVLGVDDLDLQDMSEGARPGLDHPAAVAFVAAIGGEVHPKLGWTDVARFTRLGIPAVNYGPGNPSLAHHDEERVPVEQIRHCLARMRRWLEG